MDKFTVAILVLFGISEALANIPQVQANSVFQLVFGLLAKLAGKAPKQ